MTLHVMSAGSNRAALYFVLFQNHREAEDFPNEWREVASVTIGTVVSDGTITKMGFDMNEWISPGARQGYVKTYYMLFVLVFLLL